MGKQRFTEVAIVGGGVIGASIAAHLAERKVGRVVVFEREDALGTGSTAKAAGGVRLQFTTAANVALSRYSMEEIRNFKERTGVDADFVQDGYLFLLDSEEDLARFSETAVVQRELGAPVEVITPRRRGASCRGSRSETWSARRSARRTGWRPPRRSWPGMRLWPGGRAWNCGAGVR